MIAIRRGSERGSTKTPWLDSKHTFSFGAYYDPEHMGFGTLRVINDDKIIPGEGFGAHSHKNMEIITYVLEGAVEHKDSLGTGSVIKPGEVQLMRAGSGITHSEFNPSQEHPTHLLQIWVRPDQAGLSPSYQQKNFSHKRKPNHLTMLASPTGQEESLIIHQDITLSVLDLWKGNTFFYPINHGRMIWVQVVRGSVFFGKHELTQGDGAQIVNEPSLEFLADETTEILIFDMGADA